MGWGEPRGPARDSELPERHPTTHSASTSFARANGVEQFVTNVTVTCADGAGARSEMQRLLHALADDIGAGIV